MTRPDPPDHSPRLLTTADAAAYIGVSTRTLERWRDKGTGPIFKREGKYVRYPFPGLKAWTRGDHPDGHHPDGHGPQED